MEKVLFQTLMMWTNVPALFQPFSGYSAYIITSNQPFWHFSLGFLHVRWANKFKPSWHNIG